MLSTDVLSEKEAAEAILKEKQRRNHENKVVSRFQHNAQRFAFETLLVGAGIAVSVGSLYGHYYRANPAERIRLLRSQPRLAHYLSKLSILPPESAQEVFLSYLLSLTLPVHKLRLLPLRHSLSRRDSLRPIASHLLHAFSPLTPPRSSLFVPFSTQWIDLSSLPIDESLPLTQANVVSLFQSLRSLPDFYALYLFVSSSLRNER